MNAPRTGSYWIVDTRDMVAQRVTSEATEPDDKRRYWMGWAESLEEAFASALEAVCGVSSDRAVRARRRADVALALLAGTS